MYDMIEFYLKMFITITLLKTILIPIPQLIFFLRINKRQSSKRIYLVKTLHLLNNKGLIWKLQCIVRSFIYALLNKCLIFYENHTHFFSKLYSFLMNLLAKDLFNVRYLNLFSLKDKVRKETKL